MQRGDTDLETPLTDEAQQAREALVNSVVGLLMKNV